MAACTLLFDEDEVCKPLPSGGYSFGLVLENSSYVSSDEEDSDEDDDDEETARLKRGTVRVAWHPDGTQNVIPENELILADRSLMPGDVIRRVIKGHDSQFGFVQYSRVSCHVHVLGTNKWIYNVDSRDIIPIPEWDTHTGYGDVTLGSWVGRLDIVNECITLKFSDGAKCTLTDNNIWPFEDRTEHRGKDTEFSMRDYYVGQKLIGVRGDLPEDPKHWLVTTSQHNADTVKKPPVSASVSCTVDEIKPDEVSVFWICKGFSNSKIPKNEVTHIPPRAIKGDEINGLKKLNCFEHCSIQIGDKGYYIIPEDVVFKEKGPRRHFIPSSILKISTIAPDPELINKANSSDETRKNKSNSAKDNKDKRVNCNEAAISDDLPNGLNDEEDCDEDELEEVDDELAVNGVDGTELDHVEKESNKAKEVNKDTSRKGTKKNVGGFQLKRGKPSRGRLAHNAPCRKEKEVKVGDKVPVEIYYSLTKADVMWQDGTEEKEIPSPELYPIHHLDEQEFFPGDFVVANKGEVTKIMEYGVVMKCFHKDRTCIVQWLKPYDPQKCKVPEKVGEPVEVSVYDIKDHPDFRFRPGNTVIRVGGLEECDSADVAGQIYHLDPNGVLTIRWASGSMSRCYPQDIFLVGDEMSEFGSSMYESTSEEDSDDSWETENEEELDQASVDIEKFQPQISVSEEKRVELQNLFSRALTALCKLEELFHSIIIPLPDLSKYYRDILKIHRNCRDIDKLLDLSYFDDPEINKLISTARNEVKKAKSQKLVNKVSHYTQMLSQGLSKDGTSLTDGTASKISSADSESCRTEVDKALPQSTPGPSECREVPKETSRQNSDDSDASHLLPASDEMCSSSGVSDRIHVLDVKSELGEDCSVERSVHLNIPIVNSCDMKDINSKIDEIEKLSCVGDRNSQSDGNIEGAAVCAAGDNAEGFDWTLSDFINPKTLCCQITTALRKRISDIQEEINNWKGKETPSDSLNAASNVSSLKDGSDLLASVDSSNKVASTVPESTSLTALSIIDAILNQQINKLDDCDSKTEDESFTNDSTAMDVDLEASDPVAVSDDASKMEVDKQKYHGFNLCSEVPSCHNFKNKSFIPKNQKSFTKAVRKEIQLLQSSLPPGIKVKGFEDRIDLYSVMIVGPANTPYEHGAFFFDIQLPVDYPANPPIFHYVSYCSDRLNPNLYEDGKVCVSLLGTWSGKGNEIWTDNSNFLQVLISIQGLILVSEPYYNEAGYEKQRGTQLGHENSRAYNEMAILKLVQSMVAMCSNPPRIFKDEALDHLKTFGPRMIENLEHLIHRSWQMKSCMKDSNGLEASAMANGEVNMEITEKQECIDEIGYPLLPASKGFCLTLQKHLDAFKTTLATLVENSQSQPDSNSV